VLCRGTIVALLLLCFCREQIMFRSYGRAALVATLFLTAGVASAAAILDPVLAQRLSGAGPHDVVITFNRAADASALSSLGVSFVRLPQLRMAGARLTAAQVATLRQWPSVQSIYFNAPLKYSNYTSGQITGGHYVHDTLGMKGAGTTIAVLDSGVDGTHPDLTFGGNLVQNVKLVGDLGLLGISRFLENVPNTDTTSGHGTHVAGTTGGTGSASASDSRRPTYYAGIAPEASLVGIGAGEGISILHALLGFEWALANQARYSIDVITNSWGGGDGSSFDPSNPINVASFEAYRRGIVVTFAASNSGPDENTLNQYAIAPWVINVAAGDANRQLADFSSRGVAGDELKHPDITAPGSDIASTRAVGTALGALGPVVDPNHPDYLVRYATMSGTSMATPFVAGTAALLLSANPQFSPDQVEQTLIETADPMPGYALHQVGAGYIDVRGAVETAMNASGRRAAFLAGDTAWSRQGAWNPVTASDSRLRYVGTWILEDGSRVADAVSGGGSVHAKFTGTAFKLLHTLSTDGGTADVYVDGVKRGTVNFNGAAGQRRAPFVGLEPGTHTFELRTVSGKTRLDGILLEGELFADTTAFVDSTQTFTGTMGPSVADLEIDRYPVQIPADATTLRGDLSWTGALDLDLYLVDPNGARIASGATSANPERFEYTVTQPGTYTLEVTGFATAAASYTLRSTITRALAP
jgi:serine protease AprX